MAGSDKWLKNGHYGDSVPKAPKSNMIQNTCRRQVKPNTLPDFGQKHNTTNTIPLGASSSIIISTIYYHYYIIYTLQ